MSSQFLQAELLNLIQESKRRNSELRNAAEESLNDLKALPSTSEAQISADLLRKPKFVNPFILACHSRHAKLAGIGVICLQRLVASRSLPSERLKDVLSGLKETTNMSLDIQLKILQTLPSLLQHYSSDLGGDLLVSTLEICATLQTNKMPAVSSTAAATLQQLVVSSFERVSIEDKNFGKATPTVTVKVDGSPINVGNFAYDALRVLDDLCRLVDGEPLYFLRIKSLSTPFTLELIESILLNSGRLFVTHAELTQVLRTRLMPLLVRILSERHTFSQTVRAIRILSVLLKRHMSLLPAECEMALGLVTHLLEPDGTSPWKRVLCMELFRGLYAEPGLVRLIYSLYDGEERRKNILKDHMAALVRLASEKPSLIGVSARSTVPLRSEHSRSVTEEQITLEAGGVAGVIGASVPITDSDAPGISSQWSVVRTPFMELLDKTESPSPPETYIYSLVLNCISNFAEGLAKFILPLTVPDLKQKRRSRVPGLEKGGDASRQPQDNMKNTQNRKSSVPINPLNLESHPQLAAIQSCAGIIENCWPAILAACSTFLYAALDDEFYHNLVRSFQKLAHVAGLLRLSTPRDAFLTTLGKAVIPADTGSARPANTPASATTGPQSKQMTDDKTRDSQPSLGISTLSSEANTTLSQESTIVSLSTRNLLCLRALLNLGIALGPTLDQPAWSIVLGTLQDTDILIGLTTNPQAMTSSAEASGASMDVPKANLGAEIIAVQTASAKMFESSGEYPIESFQDILAALLDLCGTAEESSQCVPESPTGELLSPRSSFMRRNTHRMSLSVGKSRTQDELVRFVLEKANEIAVANVERLSSLSEADLGAWNLLTSRLMSTAADRVLSQGLRLRANEVLNSVVTLTLKQRDGDDSVKQNERQLRNLQVLKTQVKLLYEASGCSIGFPTAPVVEIHEQNLETLKSILEQYGETFVDGWASVFDLITSVFGESAEKGRIEDSNRRNRARWIADSVRLVRVAYQSLQLIASDFVALLPLPCRLDLVESFSKFAQQQQDFNISLTTTSSFWNVSDFLQGQIEQFSIESHIDSSVSEDALANLAKGDNPSIARNALWLLLLLRIVDLTTDSRSEVRNCAIQTLLRIFDAYGQQLSPKAWCLCLNRVLFSMVEEIEDELCLTLDKNDSGNPDYAKAWIETTAVMVKGVSDLITNFFGTIVRDELFDQSWERLLGYYRRLLDLHLLEFSEATYSSLTNILLRIQSQDGIGKQSLRSTWLMWLNGHPADRKDLLSLDSPNQDAAIAYLRAFQQIYRLYKEDLEGESVEKILGHLQLLAWNSISPPYSPDIDRPSKVQALILECLKTLCSEKESSQPNIVVCLGELADSPLSKWSPESDSKKPTYVAFSKGVIDLLDWYVAEYGIKKDIFLDGSLAIALERLVNSIALRYEWPGKDRDPSLSQKSTTASLKILQVAIPYVEKQYDTCEQEQILRFWKCVVDLANGIVSARGFRTVPIPHAMVLSDETFDVAAFNRLKTLIIPSLGASTIPDSIRRDFACALLRSSFIYAPQRLDLPRKPLEEDPLHALYDIRPGRTFDPSPTPRTKMAYTVVDTLFELASAPLLAPSAQPSSEHGSSAEHSAARIALARCISPYLILRTAVSLKGYIADQPLRGLMPQPTPARKSLLHLLRGMVALRSEPSTIPTPPASQSGAIHGTLASPSDLDHKKHLAWIYPLVVRAVQVAGKQQDDGEVLRVLGQVLSA